MRARPVLFIIISMHPPPRGSQGPHTGIQKALTIKSLPNRGGISDFGFRISDLTPSHQKNHRGTESTEGNTEFFRLGLVAAAARALKCGPPAYRKRTRTRSPEVPGSHIVDVLIVNVACLASSRGIASPEHKLGNAIPARAWVQTADGGRARRGARRRVGVSCQAGDRGPTPGS